ncbi:hypothetical protein RB653_001370 [Dictyostelium firmibasis]|uniref:E3 UFM1-protein ligase 1 homolog n=1 Tax=Dictyostelium firmibasis TaxID=79012 RepID=A0AAN7U794_9MYCE
MEELEILRKKLYSIQKQDNSQKLSERNCIEIIVKMIDLKMIDIIHSLDGKEYITPKQLENEIKDEILKCGGRVVVCDLQSILSVDIIHIEDSLEKLRKRDKSIQIYQGEIMTRYYLDSILQEIQEQLQEVGKLHINDLSNRFSIGIDFLIDLIEKNLKKFNNNNNSNNNNSNNGNNVFLKNIIFDNQEVLYTQSHIDRHYHKVIGLFSSITQPCVINHIIRQHQNHYQLNERLVRQQLQDLISNKRINGFIQGKASNAEFIPTIFSQSRSKWIDSFYHQNQFITFDSISKLQINDPQSFLKNTFNDGLLLHSCFIHKSLIDKIDDNITEIIENSNWLDIIPLLPPLTNKDISMIVENCPNMKTNNAILLGDSFIISKSFVDRCFTLLQKTIQERMEKQQLVLENIASSNIKKQSQQQQQQKSDSIETVTQPLKNKEGLNNSDDDEDNKKSSKGKNKKSKQPSQNLNDSDDEKKSTKKNKNKKHKDFDGDSDDDDHYSKIGKKENNNIKKIDHLKEINQLLTKWYENMEEELVQSLSQYLRPLVNQAWESMVKEAKEKLENEAQKQRKQQLQQLNGHFFSLYNSFLLFKKGLLSLGDPKSLDEEKTITALEKHLLKTVCTNITNLLIEINASYHMLDKTTFETTSERTLMLSQFPPQLSKNFEKLIQSLNKSTLNDFIDSLDKICSQSQIKLKSLDKKLEKQLLSENQNELEEQFLNEIDIGNQFQIIVNLMYIRYKNNYIFSPPRLIGKLVSSLVIDSSIDKEITARLTKLHQEIVSLITNNKSNELCDNDNTELNDNIKFFKDLILN